MPSAQLFGLGENCLGINKGGTRFHQEEVPSHAAYPFPAATENGLPLCFQCFIGSFC